MVRFCSYFACRQLRSQDRNFIQWHLSKKAKQRLQRPLKSKMHNSAIYGPIWLIFCMQVAHVSGQKLYLVAFVKKGQTKAAKALPKCLTLLLMVRFCSNFAWRQLRSQDRNLIQWQWSKNLNRLKPARKTIELPFHKSLGKNVYTNIRRTAFLGKQSRLKPLRTTIELTFH